MTLAEFKDALRKGPSLTLKFILPDDDEIPKHAHITECGRVEKLFVDCGGALHNHRSCLLQAWVSDDIDHRLAAGTLANILEKASFLFDTEELPVEIEYEDCTLSQFQVVSSRATGSEVQFYLREKHTDCLAKELCLPRADAKQTGQRARCC